MPNMPGLFRPSHQRERIERRRDYDRKRDTQEWRSWYKTKRWQRLAASIYLRDGYVCQVTGELLSGAYPAPNSPVADHIVEHEGDPVLFWDPTSIRTVSKAYHDKQRQSEQRAARLPGGGVQKSRTLRR